MNATFEKMREDALKLSIKEREFLAIEADRQRKVDEAWKSEISNRVREINEGTVKGILAQDVHDELRQQRSS